MKKKRLIALLMVGAMAIPSVNSMLPCTTLASVKESLTELPKSQMSTTANTDVNNSANLGTVSYTFNGQTISYTDTIHEGITINKIQMQKPTNNLQIGVENITGNYTPAIATAKVKVITKIYSDNKRVDEVTVTNEAATKTYLFEYQLLKEIPKTGMVATASSEYKPTTATTGDGGAQWAIDGNMATWWHNNWSAPASSPEKTLPYYLTINLSDDNSLVNLESIRVRTRDNTYNSLKHIKLFYSTDGTTFKNVFIPGEESGTYTAGDQNQILLQSNLSNTIKFDKIQAKQLRLVIYSTYTQGGGALAANVAEIDFYNAPTENEGKKLSGWFDNFGSPVTDFSESKTVYAHYSDALTINVIKGTTGEGQTQDTCFYNERVTVEAEDPADATQQFAGWYNGEQLISTQKIYSFYAYKSMDLTAKYIAVSEAKPTIQEGITMDHVELIPNKSGSYNVRFIGHVNTEMENTIQETGFVYTGRQKADLADDQITVETANTNEKVRTCVIGNANYVKQFSVTVTNVPADKLVRGKFFIKLVSGETFTYNYSQLGEQNTRKSN